MAYLVLQRLILIHMHQEQVELVIFQMVVVGEQEVYLFMEAVQVMLLL